MRTNIARGVIVVFTAVMLSGCYSNGGWHMPGQSSPFQSGQSTSPGSVGAPVKPSGIAAAGSTAPTSGYPSPASGMTGPVVSQGVPASYNAAGTGYSTAPYSYPPTNGTTASTATPGYGGTPYTASRSGSPGYGASSPGTATNGYGPASTAPASPYGNTSPYSNPAAAPSYGASPAGSYNSAPSYNPAGNTAGGYGPSSTSPGAYANPVRPAQGSSYPETTGTSGYGSGADRYGNAAGTPTTSYGAGGGSRYGDPTPNTSGSSAPGTNGSSYSAPAGGGRLRATAGHQLRHSGHGQRNWLELLDSGGRHRLCTAADHQLRRPAAGTGGSYPPSAGSATPPATGGGDPASYRPGSTSDYVPQRPARSCRARFLPRRQPVQALRRPDIRRPLAASEFGSNLHSLRRQDRHGFSPRRADIVVCLKKPVETGQTGTSAPPHLPPPRGGNYMAPAIGQEFRV